jgi:hypothetical protein
VGGLQKQGLLGEQNYADFLPELAVFILMVSPVLVGVFGGFS